MALYGLGEKSILKSPFIIGRSPDADIVLRNKFVSRSLCLFEVNNNNWFLKIIGATEVSVNKCTISNAKTVQLNNGDIIRIEQIDDDVFWTFKNSVDDDVLPLNNSQESRKSSKPEDAEVYNKKRINWNQAASQCSPSSSKDVTSEVAKPNGSNELHSIGPGKIDVNLEITQSPSHETNNSSPSSSTVQSDVLKPNGHELPSSGPEKMDIEVELTLSQRTKNLNQTVSECSPSTSKSLESDVLKPNSTQELPSVCHEKIEVHNNKRSNWNQATSEGSSAESAARDVSLPNDINLQMSGPEEIVAESPLSQNKKKSNLDPATSDCSPSSFKNEPSLDSNPNLGEISNVLHSLGLEKKENKKLTQSQNNKSLKLNQAASANSSSTSKTRPSGSQELHETEAPGQLTASLNKKRSCLNQAASDSPPSTSKSLPSDVLTSNGSLALRNFGPDDMEVEELTLSQSRLNLNQGTSDCSPSTSKSSQSTGSNPSGSHESHNTASINLQLHRLSPLTINMKRSYRANSEWTLVSSKRVPSTDSKPSGSQKIPCVSPNGTKIEGESNNKRPNLNQTPPDCSPSTSRSGSSTASIPSGSQKLPSVSLNRIEVQGESSSSQNRNRSVLNQTTPECFPSTSRSGPSTVSTPSGSRERPNILPSRLDVELALRPNRKRSNLKQVTFEFPPMQRYLPDLTPQDIKEAKFKNQMKKLELALIEEERNCRTHILQIKTDLEKELRETDMDSAEISKLCRRELLNRLLKKETEKLLEVPETIKTRPNDGNGESQNKSGTFTRLLEGEGRKLEIELNDFGPTPLFSPTAEQLIHIIEELQCVICTEPFIKPVNLNCTHTLCEYCYKQWKIVHKNTSCPICRMRITTATAVLVVDHFLDRVVTILGDEYVKRREVVFYERYPRVSVIAPPPKKRKTQGVRFQEEAVVVTFQGMNSSSLIQRIAAVTEEYSNPPINERRRPRRSTDRVVASTPRRTRSSTSRLRPRTVQRDSRISVIDID